MGSGSEVSSGCAVTGWVYRISAMFGVRVLGDTYINVELYNKGPRGSKVPIW